MMSEAAPLRQGLRYALLGLAALAAIALSESILQSTSSLYLAFAPRVYLDEAWALAALLAGLALLGAVLDQPQRPRWLAGAARGLLLALLFVALFQIFRRSLAAGMALSGMLKLALLTACVLGAALAVWRLQLEAQWRLASAAAVAMLSMFALQPGMPGYLLSLAKPVEARPAPATLQPTLRRTLVLVLDEWDLEISQRAGLFERSPLREMQAQSFVATRAMPAGPNTLASIPGMLQGRRFGALDSGGAGYLESRAGERFDQAHAGLFNDLAEAGIGYGVVGFYHDYCAIARSARRCHAEPVQFFPGWWAALTRSVKRGQEFDYPYSDFLRQWSATLAALRAEAQQTLADPGNQVVWLHLNVPHPPIALAGGRAQSLALDYQANLDLLQTVVSELRDALQAGQGDVAMVLTSDHWLREKELWAGIYERQRGPGSGSAGKRAGDQHVPFMVWFSQAAGEGLQFDGPVSTTSLRELVPALAQRRLNSPAEIAAFMQARAARLGPGETQPFDDLHGAAVHAGDGHHH